jgi:hypothetical protein
MKRKRYKIISEDLQKNLIEFLDEMQFEAAGNNDKDSMHIVNFCNWAINELLNSYDGYVKDKPNKKSREDYVDETFMDWNLPEMSDDEYEKLVDSFDGFLKGWEKEYNKKNPKKKAKKEPTFRPHIDDVSEYMSLKEIEEYLLDDPDLTTEEAFDLYYDEHKRVERAKERKKLKSLNQICKELGIQYPKDDEKN